MVNGYSSNNIHQYIANTTIGIIYTMGKITSINNIATMNQQPHKDAIIDDESSQADVMFAIDFLYGQSTVYSTIQTANMPLMAPLLIK